MLRTLLRRHDIGYARCRSREWNSAGACIINGSGNYRLAHQPFGGYKLSGVGREGAVCTLEEMTQQKMISFKGS
ncbi:MAG: aldehyde dehydrogenase family protein [Ruthenibacterium lactatiformans]